MEAFGSGEVVLHLQLLSQIDRLDGLELAMIEASVQANPTCDDMDVLMVPVPMEKDGVLMAAKTHAIHEIGGNFGPAVVVKGVARRYRKACVPYWALNARPSRTGQAKLKRQLARVCPRHVAANDPAGVTLPKPIVQDASEAAATFNLCLHRASSQSGQSAPR